MSVQSNNTCLIGLRNIGEDAVDHADEHAVLERVTGVLDDRNNVCAVCGHVDQVATRSVGEFDSEDGTSWADNVSNVRDGCSRCSSKVENLAARLHVDVLETTQDTCSQLRSERIPYAVFGLCRDGVAVGRVAGRGVGCVDGDALLAVDGLTWRQVLRYEQIFLAASDKDTGVSVRLDDDFLATLEKQSVLDMVEVHLFALPLRQHHHVLLLVHHDLLVHLFLL